MRPVIGFDLFDRVQGDEAAAAAQEPTCPPKNPPAAIAQHIRVVKHVEHFVFDLLLLIGFRHRDVDWLIPDCLLQVLVVETKLGRRIFCEAFIPRDGKPQTRIELAHDEGRFEITRERQDAELLEIDVTLGEQQLIDFFYEVRPARSDGMIGPAELGPDISAAIVENRIELIK